jgi:hypothetical protein
LTDWILPVEKSQSNIPSTLLAKTHQTMAVMTVQIINHITSPPRRAHKTIPGHQALEGSNIADPKNIPHQIRKNTSETNTDIGSCGGTGISTTSPSNTGVIAPIADSNHSK